MSDDAARAVIDSLPVSPGMTAAVGSGAGDVGDALAAELRRRGLSVDPAGRGVDVAFVAGDATSAALDDALSRCRDRGLVVYVADGKSTLAGLDLYAEVHSRGLRLTFRSLEDSRAAGESS